MVPWTWEWWLAVGTMSLLMLVGVLLMIVILLQRGRGGGLAGAFGGAGGQSAFGTRAGDVFTKITAIMAIVWVFLAGVSRFALEPAANQYADKFETEAELEQQSQITSAGKAGESEGEETTTPPPANGKTPESEVTPEKTPAETEPPSKDPPPPAENDETPETPNENEAAPPNE